MSLSFKQPLTAPEFVGASNRIVSVSKFGTVVAALSYIGADNYMLVLDQNSAENFTVPANVTLFPAGGKLSGTVTINGFIMSEPRIQIFNGATLTLGANVRDVYPEWWGGCW